MTKINGLISIARKAGFCVIGLDKLKNHDQKLYSLIVDNKAGNSLMREVKHISEKRGIPLVEIENLQEYVSIENCKVIGIKNKALSDNILRCIKGDD